MPRCNHCIALFASFYKFNLLQNTLKLQSTNTYDVLKRLTTTALASSNNETNSGLHITEACAKQLKKIASPDEFLRVSVEGGGCSGFSYKFALDKTIQDDDVSFERDGIKVVSDHTTLEFIKGSTVDYEIELIKSAFLVKDNPQSSTKCSCGVSFAID